MYICACQFAGPLSASRATQGSALQSSVAGHLGICTRRLEREGFAFLDSTEPRERIAHLPCREPFCFNSGEQKLLQLQNSELCLESGLKTNISALQFIVEVQCHRLCAERGAMFTVS